MIPQSEHNTNIIYKRGSISSVKAGWWRGLEGGARGERVALGLYTDINIKVSKILGNLLRETKRFISRTEGKDWGGAHKKILF